VTKYFAIGAAVLAAIAGMLSWLLLKAHEDLGKAELALRNANAVIAQKEADAKLSALLIANLQGRVQQIDATAAPVRERIIHVPVTSSCGPAIAAAVAGVQQLLRTDPGGPATGREPAPAVRPAQAPAR
jgi:hypothetical protein